jgi:hypothetical protein
MQKHKSCAWVIVTHDCNDHVFMPVEHIIPRPGAPSTATMENVLILVSPDNRRALPDTVVDKHMDSNLLNLGQDEGPPGAIHYIQVPHHKRYQAAVQ